MATLAAPMPTLRRTLGPLLLLGMAMAVGFTMMGAFGTVQEGAKAELRLSDTQMGLIQGVGAAVPLVLFSIPIGILVDRFNRIRLLILMAAIWSAGTALTAVASGPAMLMAARILVGMGAGGGLTAALSLGADLCPPDQRGRAMLIVSMGKSLGIALGFAAAGTLFGVFTRQAIDGFAPWRSVHIALAVASAALVLPLLILREPARQEVEASTHAPFRVIFAELWSRRAFLLPLFIGQVTVVMADNAALVWASPILSRNYGLRPDQFAGWMGALVLGTNIVGTLFGGLAADYGHKHGRRGGLLLGALAAAAIGTPAALFPITGSVPVFAMVFGVFALAGSITGVITSVALTVYLPNELRGLSIGAFIAVAGVVGFGLAPPMVAMISGWLGGEAHLGQALALVGVVTSAMSVAGFLFAIRRAPVAAVA